MYEVRLICALERSLNGIEEKAIELMHILMIDGLRRRELIAKVLREYRTDLVRLPTEAVGQSNG